MGIYGESKIGSVRKLNEDSFYISKNKDIVAVADGMGGYAGGEIASKTAVDGIAYYFQNYSYTLPEQLVKAVQYANSCILSKTMIDPSLKGMGTTLSMITLCDDKVIWAHVGDSRIYLFRAGQLEQITLDHSFVEELLQKGKITPEEALHHPNKNVLTRAVGVDRQLDVDSGSFVIEKNDRILLCTDGLNTHVTTSDIIEALSDYTQNERDILNSLFKIVYQNGARDNVTAVLLTI